MNDKILKTVSYAAVSGIMFTASSIGFPVFYGLRPTIKSVLYTTSIGFLIGAILAGAFFFRSNFKKIIPNKSYRTFADLMLIVILVLPLAQLAKATLYGLAK